MVLVCCLCCLRLVAGCDFGLLFYCWVGCLVAYVLCLCGCFAGELVVWLVCVVCLRFCCLYWLRFLVLLGCIGFCLVMVVDA